MTTNITIETAVHFATRPYGRKDLVAGAAETPRPMPSGRVPRVSRLMALAHRFQRLIAEGTVADYAELARLGHVSRSRISQIMNLLLLAPDIQEALLFLPPTLRGGDTIRLAQLQPLAAAVSWRTQRRLWQDLNRCSA